MPANREVASFTLGSKCQAALEDESRRVCEIER